MEIEKNTIINRINIKKILGDKFYKICLTSIPKNQNLL